MGLSHPHPVKDQEADDSAEFARPTPRREASLPERDLETTTPTASPSRWSKLLHKPNIDLPPAPTVHTTNPDAEPSTSTFLNMIKSTFRKEDTLQLAELSEWQDEESLRPKAVSPLPLKWLGKRRPLSGSSPKTFASSLEDSPMFSLGTTDRYSEIKSRKPKNESPGGFQAASLSDMPPCEEHEEQETLREEVTTVDDEAGLPSSRRSTKGEHARTTWLTTVSFHSEVVYKVIERLPEFAHSTGPATEKIGDTGIVPLSDRMCIPDDPAWCGDHADDLSPVEEGECKEWVLRQGWTTLSNTYHNEFIDKDLPSENGYVEPFIEMLQAGSFDDEPWRPEVAVEDGRIIVKERSDTEDDSAARSEGTQGAESAEGKGDAPPADNALEKKPSVTDIRVIAECFPAPPGGTIDIRRSSSKSPPSSRRTSLASVAELVEEPTEMRTSRRRSPLSSTNPTIAALAPQAQTLFDTQNRLNEDLSRELEGYSTLLSQLESKLSDRDSVIKRLVRDHAQERRRLKKEVADRDALVERLNAEAERPQEPSVRSEPGDSSAITGLQEQLAAATDKLSSLELQHQNLESDHDEAVAELEHTRQQLADSNDALEKASEDLYAARDAIDSSEHRIAQVEEQRDQLHAQVERERNARLDAERKWQEELSDLRQELEEERAARRRLEKAQAAQSETAQQAQTGRSQSRTIPGSSVNSMSGLGHSRTQSRELLGFSPPAGLGNSTNKRGSGGFLRDSWASAKGKRGVLAPAAPQKSTERTIAQLERTVEELVTANERLSLGMSSLQQERELLRRKLQRAEHGHSGRPHSLRH